MTKALINGVRPILIHGDTCAVIQAHNSEKTIRHVLSQLVRAGVGSCVVAANGCTDTTVSAAVSFFKTFAGSGNVVVFPEKLGPDVGKAAGTYAALRWRSIHPRWFVYIDSDWQGGFGPRLEQFIHEAKHKQADVLFSGRVGNSSHSRFHARQDLQLWRTALTQIDPDLTAVSVSESPIVVNRQVFSAVSPYWLHQPGLWAAQCLLHRPPLQLAVSTEWIPQFSGNPARSAAHQNKMMETLIGDAVEGIAILSGLPQQREWKGREWVGYHGNRREDLLRDYMQTLTIT